MQKLKWNFLMKIRKPMHRLTIWGNGIFTYAAPVAGWWGFAALNTSDKKMMHNNVEKDIELGAVLWVKFEAWQAK